MVELEELLIEDDDIEVEIEDKVDVEVEVISVSIVEKIASEAFSWSVSVIIADETSVLLLY